MVFLFIEDTLRDLGCGEIWHAASVAEALALLDEIKPDAALVDVNLHGEKAYPIAERLAARGVPFLFSTGYGQTGLSGEWAGRPVIEKPFEQACLAKALTDLFAR